MANRKTKFVLGEWYHCYNTSIEKLVAFKDLQDYHRFLELLYLANDELPLRRNDIGPDRFEEVLMLPRKQNLAAIGAFCLMPDHFHLALKETVEGGVTAFMRKLGTAYTMYFNARHKRTGNLFLKPFQSFEVSSTDSSLSRLINYVHSAPAILYEPEWKANHVVDPQFLEERLIAYPYSSLRAYSGAPVAVSAILDSQTLSAARLAPLNKRLLDAQKYSAGSKIF
jgi:REP element-mobilizing transposase RayT